MRHDHAPDLIERTEFTALGEAVILDRCPGVFMPTAHGLFYAGTARVAAGERVIDIGTGSGVLAIAAARRGAHVVATDTDERAIEAARHNALVNGVTIDVRAGSLFDGAAGPFDVILANLPNEIVAPAYLATLSEQEAHVFAGGVRGNAALLALLDAAPAHMHAGTRLYLGVHSLTDWHDTLRAALDGFTCRLLDFRALPLKGHALAHLDHFLVLQAAGTVTLYRDREGTWRSWVYLYELTRRP
jgi:release factor glutamine methyltransferase